MADIIISNKNNIDKTTREFCEFDPSNNEWVILLKGEWGTGKTYLINKIKDDLHDENKKEFLYVSLLGLDNIEEVKNRIVSPYKNENNTKNIFGDILKAAAGTTAIGSLLSNTATGIFDYIAENRLTNKIIILDDLERKGDKLSMLSIFGLIDFLKQKKNKVIILSNEEKIVKEEDSKNLINNNSWQLLKEKIIDREIKLNINHEDCLNILMKDVNKEELEYKVINVLLLDTKLINLRIITLIRNRLKELLNILEPKKTIENEIILIAILVNIAKMFYIYYTYENYDKYLNVFQKYLCRDELNSLFFQQYSEKKPKNEVEEAVDQLSINNSYDLSDIFDITYNNIKWGFWEKEDLEIKLKDILDNIDSINNQEKLFNFENQLMFGKIENLEEKLDYFLNLNIKKPGTICIIYNILKKLKHEKLSLYKDKIENLGLNFQPKFYIENPEFENPYSKNILLQEEQTKESLYSMLFFHTNKDFVKEYLNNIDIDKLKELFIKELDKNNLPVIFEQINIIKNNTDYLNFINIIKSLYINILSVDEMDNLKRIFILNPLE